MKNQRLRPLRPPGLLQASEYRESQQGTAAESVQNPVQPVTAVPRVQPVTAVLRGLPDFPDCQMVQATLERHLRFPGNPAPVVLLPDLQHLNLLHSLRCLLPRSTHFLSCSSNTQLPGNPVRRLVRCRDGWDLRAARQACSMPVPRLVRLRVARRQLWAALQHWTPVSELPRVVPALECCQVAFLAWGRAACREWARVECRVHPPLLRLPP